MAISATKQTILTSANGYNYHLIASFTENSVNQQANTSNITCTGTLQSLGATWSSSYNSNLTIYWHDNNLGYDLYVASVNMTKLNPNGAISATGTINATHNDDGTLSGYAYAWFSKGGNSAYTPISGGVKTDLTALTPIARASIPSINTWPSNSPNFNIGDTIVIHMNRKSTDFTHNVYINYGNTRYQVGTNIADNVSFDTDLIASQLYALIPNSNTYTNTVTVETYNGSTLIGSATCQYIARVVNSNPTFNVAYLDTNGTTTAITGNNQQIIRNNSTLQVNITNATALNSASLSSATLTINGNSISSSSFTSGSLTFNVGTVNSSQNLTAAVRVTDSRGNSTTKNLTITMINWQLPYATISCQRDSNYYPETNLTVNGSYSSLEGNNTLTIQYRYKKTTDTNYSAYTTIANNTEETFSIDNMYKWNVQVLLTDRLGSITYNLVVPKGIPLIFYDILNSSISFNGIPAYPNSFMVNGVGVNEVVLYNDATGSKNAITLSETSANFTYLEIFYRTNDNFYNSVKIYQPNGKSATLIGEYPYSNEGVQICTYAKKTIVSISGISITPTNYAEVQTISGSNGHTVVNNNNNNYITRVVGYR